MSLFVDQLLLHRINGLALLCFHCAGTNPCIIWGYLVACDCLKLLFQIVHPISGLTFMVINSSCLYGPKKSCICNVVSRTTKQSKLSYYSFHLAFTGKWEENFNTSFFLFESLSTSIAETDYNKTQHKQCKFFFELKGLIFFINTD